MLRTLRRCFSLPWSLAAVERYKCKHCRRFCPRRILHFFPLSVRESAGVTSHISKIYIGKNMNPKQWAHQTLLTRPDQTIQDNPVHSDHHDHSDQLDHSTQDPGPISANQYRPILIPYHQILTSTAFYWASIIMYQPVLLHTNSIIIYQPALSYTDQVPTSTAQCQNI